MTTEQLQKKIHQVLKQGPEFGEKIKGQHYIPRPGAYAVIQDEAGQVAVVKTSQGIYLPGGGSEPGERLEDTLTREVREECGFGVDILHKIGVADQYVFAEEESTYFRKQCTFFRARVSLSSAGRAPNTEPRTQHEQDHTLLWLTPEEAVETISHESQAWAVQTAYRL